MAKNPGRKQQPKTGKQPITGVRDVETRDQYFHWRTHTVDLEGPFGWGDVPPETILHDIVPKLHERELTTWQDLRNGRSHPVSTDQFSKPAKRRLEERYPDFVGDTLFSLRLTGKCRLWGQQVGAILQVFWYDPDHQVCPSDPD